MKRLALFAVALLVVVTLMGCSMKRDKGTETNNNANNATTNATTPQGQNNTVNNNAENNATAGTEANLTVAKEAAIRITDEIPEVDTATVIASNHNAYVAVMLKSGTEGKITDTLEHKMADIVKATDKNIQTVHVSSNPDFIERMTDYGKRINEGHPVAGFFEEFTESVNRVFPNVR